MGIYWNYAQTSNSQERIKEKKKSQGQKSPFHEGEACKKKIFFILFIISSDEYCT